MKRIVTYLCLMAWISQAIVPPTVYAKNFLAPVSGTSDGFLTPADGTPADKTFKRDTSKSGARRITHSPASGQGNPADPLADLFFTPVPEANQPGADSFANDEFDASNLGDFPYLIHIIAEHLPVTIPILRQWESEKIEYGSEQNIPLEQRHFLLLQFQTIIAPIMDLTTRAMQEFQNSESKLSAPIYDTMIIGLVDSMFQGNDNTISLPAITDGLNQLISYMASFYPMPDEGTEDSNFRALKIGTPNQNSLELLQHLKSELAQEFPENILNTDEVSLLNTFRNNIASATEVLLKSPNASQSMPHLKEVFSDTALKSAQATIDSVNAKKFRNYSPYNPHVLKHIHAILQSLENEKFNAGLFLEPLSKLINYLSGHSQSNGAYGETLPFLMETYSAVSRHFYGGLGDAKPVFEALKPHANTIVDAIQKLDLLPSNPKLTEDQKTDASLEVRNILAEIFSQMKLEIELIKMGDRIEQRETGEFPVRYDARLLELLSNIFTAARHPSLDIMLVDNLMDIRKYLVRYQHVVNNKTSLDLIDSMLNKLLKYYGSKRRGTFPRYFGRLEKASSLLLMMIQNIDSINRQSFSGEKTWAGQLAEKGKAISHTLKSGFQIITSEGNSFLNLDELIHNADVVDPAMLEKATLFNRAILLGNSALVIKVIDDWIKYLDRSIIHHQKNPSEPERTEALVNTIHSHKMILENLRQGIQIILGLTESPLERPALPEHDIDSALAGIKTPTIPPKSNASDPTQYVDFEDSMPLAFPLVTPSRATIVAHDIITSSGISSPVDEPQYVDTEDGTLNPVISTRFSTIHVSKVHLRRSPFYRLLFWSVSLVHASLLAITPSDSMEDVTHPKTYVEKPFLTSLSESVSIAAQATEQANSKTRETTSLSPADEVLRNLYIEKMAQNNLKFLVASEQVADWRPNLVVSPHGLPTITLAFNHLGSPFAGLFITETSTQELESRGITLADINVLDQNSKPILSILDYQDLPGELYLIPSVYPVSPTIPFLELQAQVTSPPDKPFKTSGEIASGYLLSPELRAHARVTNHGGIITLPLPNPIHDETLQGYANITARHKLWHRLRIQWSLKEIHDLIEQQQTGQLVFVHLLKNVLSGIRSIRERDPHNTLWLELDMKLFPEVLYLEHSVSQKTTLPINRITQLNKILELIDAHTRLQNHSTTLSVTEKFSKSA